MLVQWHGTESRKSTFMSFTRNTNNIALTYKVGRTQIACSQCVNDLGALLDTEINFHSRADQVVGRALKMLGLIRYVMSSVSTGLIILYVPWSGLNFNSPLQPGIVLNSLIRLKIKEFKENIQVCAM